MPATSRRIDRAKLQQKAQKTVTHDRKKKEDLARIEASKVIEDWAVPSDIRDKSVTDPPDAGADKEKRLRKVGQSGVVKLFNAILNTQKTNEMLLQEQQHSKSTKAKLPAPSTTTGLNFKPNELGTYATSNSSSTTLPFQSRCSHQTNQPRFRKTHF